MHNFYLKHTEEIKERTKKYKLMLRKNGICQSCCKRKLAKNNKTYCNVCKEKKRKCKILNSS